MKQFKHITEFQGPVGDADAYGIQAWLYNTDTNLRGPKLTCVSITDKQRMEIASIITRRKFIFEKIYVRGDWNGLIILAHTVTRHGSGYIIGNWDSGMTCCDPGDVLAVTYTLDSTKEQLL